MNDPFIFVYGSVVMFLSIAIVVLIIHCASLHRKGAGPKDVLRVAAWVLLGIVVGGVILSCGGLTLLWFFFGR